jgi:glutamate/aspartate transport system permease protein
MRLSGKPWLVIPAAAYVNTMRSIPLVMVILWFFLLIPLLIGRPMGAELSAIITFTVFEAAYYSEIMRRHPERAQGPGACGLRGGHDLQRRPCS